MDMAGNNTNVSSDCWQASGSNLTITPVGMIPIGDRTVDSSSRSPAPLADNPFCQPMWDPPIGGRNMFLPSVSGMPGPMSLPDFPHDSGFIDRAARFSCFGSGNLAEMMNPFSSPSDVSPYSRRLGFIQESTRVQMNEMDVSEVSKEASKNDRNVSGNESEEAEFSGQCVQEDSSSKGFDSKKRKRGRKGNERNENNRAPQPTIEMTKDNAETKPKGSQKGTSVSKNVKEGSQGSDLPKEDYIHVRARRGQATNSHSLAERVRREKISERMKFLQDLVPGCSKVTGKAVMLDEIINYVQSLQRQVEFLSMKLATVNPRLDFNIEGLLAKDILQHRGGGMSPSLAFPSEMNMPFPSLHHQSPPGLILVNNSSENLRRTINLQSISIPNGFKEPTSQVPSVWEDELHNIVHMGFNSSAALNSQDLIGSLPPGHMKAEP